MTKVETVTFEYEHCGECDSADSTWRSSKSKWYCVKFTPWRLLKKADLWGDIPDWCPLEDKKEEKDGR